jgi:hypothetical protein
MYWYSCSLAHRCDMGKYCDCEKTDIEILMELHIFSMSEYEKLDFGTLSVCVCGYVCTY